VEPTMARLAQDQCLAPSGNHQLLPVFFSLLDRRQLAHVVDFAGNTDVGAVLTPTGGHAADKFRCVLGPADVHYGVRVYSWSL